MARGVDSRNTGNDFVARLDKRRPVRQRQTYLYEQFSIEFPSLPNVFATFPEIEFRGAENVTGFRKYRLAAFCQPPNVIGMSVRYNDDIDVFRLVSSSSQPFGGLSRRQTLTKLLVFARQRTIASVEQNELFAGVHERRNVRMFKSLGINIVRARQGVHLIRRSIGAVVG